MNILMLHNRYKIMGGEDVSTEAEIDLLRNAGHEVTFLEADNHEITGTINKARAALSTVWSRRWYQIVDEKLRTGQFDILHVQNFFPLISPAVYYAASRHGVKVVQAVRNYRIACPAYNLFRNGSLCTDCVGTTFKLPGIRRRCYRGSRVGTGAIAAMSGVHRIAGTWQNKVDRYIAISDYVADILCAEGVPGEKISIKPNFVNLEKYKSSDINNDRSFILYVGRISPEKGIDILLDAYEKTDTDIPLYIVGEGDTQNITDNRVRLLGRKPLPEVYELMHNAHCVILPGGWPEPFGRVAVEAFACGTPVIASDIGGLVEIVDHGQNGFLFEVGNSQDLASKLDLFLSTKTNKENMRQTAYSSYREKYTPAKNLEMITELYQSVIG